ncbi:bifunctional allantoicase/(S)-ureidoglycine aminohydrolase [Neotabrizicola sp. VNH66]|uniref:bifunctional allantoicase/(S)-ureidoglycine aminohydrolase n=1 Tax=Neotabrizicola sp. VNH66 TaxID=3400918 RepID=UPI003C039FC8
MTRYATPADGLPPQTAIHTGRAVFTEAYAVIPRGVMRDIVTSFMPGWTKTHFWVIARPMSGFSETFSQYILTIDPEGGSDTPEPEAGAEGVLFVTEGRPLLTIGGTVHPLAPGGYAYLPPGTPWTLKNPTRQPAKLHWVRKLYEPAPGLEVPPPFVTNEQHLSPAAMPDTKGAWATTRFVDPYDLRHDMHVNIVTFQPGGLIPFEETHVMEHGLYVLEGKAVYKLNRDWVEVEAGDFMWLRAYCPQACYAGGPGPFRYLLYKDVNRHAKLRGPGAFGR